MKWFSAYLPRLLPIVVVLAALTGTARSAPVELRAAEERVDPLRPPANAGDMSAVFLPAVPVSAKQLLLRLVFPGPDPEAYFGKFGVDVTTDASPAAEGRWMPLILETTSAAEPAVPLAAVPLVTLEKRAAPFTVSLRARVPFDGITGFRLRVFAEERADGSRAPGRAADGSFLLGDFLVEADQPRSTNLALGRQVYCSRAVRAGFPSRNLTDGFHATWCQPEREPGQTEGFFQLDLGQITALDHLTLRRPPEADGGVVPHGYEIELLTESGGFDSEVLWRTERPFPQKAEAVIRPADGRGEFAGRSLMIRSRGGAGDEPKVAEIEVYPALRPTARQWLADGRALGSAAGPVNVPAGARGLTFVPVSGLPAEGLSRCRWRLGDAADAWTESALGEPVTLAVPPPGEYSLLVQALHSDGVWDTSGAPVLLRVAAPWWSHGPTAAAAWGGAALLLGAGWWWLHERRLRRRLSRTERHLALHRDRLRISRDMHDEIGARLTSIAMLAERTRHGPDHDPLLLDDLAHQARDTVEALDTIVWAVNPHHDTAGGLADYLSDYAPVYLRAAGIDCALDFRIDAPDRPLSLAVRHNLLMAAKEALQNVVKHSGAARCTVTLTDAGGRELEARVEDDGRGFDPAAARGPSHTGVNAMRQRMAEAGGECAFSPGDAAGPGTRVRLAVPLARGKA